MFRDRYRKEMENITPDSYVVSRIARKINESEQKKQERNKHPVLLGTAVCLCLLLCLLLIPYSRTISRPFGEGNDLRAAGSYRVIEQAVAACQARQQTSILDNGLLSLLFHGQKKSLSTSPEETPPLPDTATNAAPDGTGNNHSETNVQVEGVDEGDILKTDGRYLYRLSGSRLIILDTNKELQIVTEQYLEEIRPQEMYLCDTVLVITGTCKSGTQICVFDISDPTAPLQTGTLIQEGRFLASRMTRGYLYLITETQYFGETPPKTTGTDGSLSPIPADRIYLGKEISDTNYLILTALDVNQPQFFSDVRAVLGSGDTVYATADRLYVTNSQSSAIQDGNLLFGLSDRESSNFTNLISFSLEQGKIEPLAWGSVPGCLLNQFSMDEANGYFRLVTTVLKNSKRSNSLYILDANLQTVGKIEGLAPNESIYSARFLGNFCYFVTYRQIDPLFAADLSDPQNPKILSELKIPGFSRYLHPYGEGLLFGLGETDTGTIKLSMFDISDPTAVTELCTKDIGSYYSEALFNHKALLISPKQNLIGFQTETYRYEIYQYNASLKMFQIKASLTIPTKENALSTQDNARAAYIGQILYLTWDGGAAAYSMNNYELLSCLHF